jgi:hypothetical protein
VRPRRDREVVTVRSRGHHGAAGTPTLLGAIRGRARHEEVTRRSREDHEVEAAWRRVWGGRDTAGGRTTGLLVRADVVLCRRESAAAAGARRPNDGHCDGHGAGVGCPAKGTGGGGGARRGHGSVCDGEAKMRVDYGVRTECMEGCARVLHGGIGRAQTFRCGGCSCHCTVARWSCFPSCRTRAARVSCGDSGREENVGRDGIQNCNRGSKPNLFLRKKQSAIKIRGSPRRSVITSCGDFRSRSSCKRRHSRTLEGLLSGHRRGQGCIGGASRP